MESLKNIERGIVMTVIEILLSVLIFIVCVVIEFAIWTGFAALGLWLLSIPFGFSWTFMHAVAIGACLFLFKKLFACVKNKND